MRGRDQAVLVNRARFEALLRVEVVAAQVITRLTGAPGRWRYDGKGLSDAAAIPLLALTDFVNEAKAMVISDV